MIAVRMSFDQRDTSFPSMLSAKTGGRCRSNTSACYSANLHPLSVARGRRVAAAPAQGRPRYPLTHYRVTYSVAFYVTADDMTRAIGDGEQEPAQRILAGLLDDPSGAASDACFESIEEFDAEGEVIAANPVPRRRRGRRIKRASHPPWCSVKLAAANYSSRNAGCRYLAVRYFC